MSIVLNISIISKTVKIKNKHIKNDGKAITLYRLSVYPIFSR